MRTGPVAVVSVAGPALESHPDGLSARRRGVYRGAASDTLRTGTAPSARRCAARREWRTRPRPWRLDYGAEIANEGLVTFGGGLPLAVNDGAIIGASGSPAEDDAAVTAANPAAVGGVSGTPAP